MVLWIIFTGMWDSLDSKLHFMVHPELIFTAIAFSFHYAFYTGQTDFNILVDSQ